MHSPGATTDFRPGVAREPASGQGHLQPIIGETRGEATLARHGAELRAQPAFVPVDDPAAAMGEHRAPHAGVCVRQPQRDMVDPPRIEARELGHAGFAARWAAGEVDERGERMGAKIRDAQNQKIPYMLVVGDREM